MSLKLGQRERAAAEYKIILRDEALTDENEQAEYVCLTSQENSEIDQTITDALSL